MLKIPRLSWNKFFMLHAHLAATRSTCDRGPELMFHPGRHGVGAVIVKDNRIIAGGYNGSPPGQPHCDEAGHYMVEGHCVPGDTLISKFQTGRYNTGHRTIRQIYQNWRHPQKCSAMKRMKIRSVTDTGLIVPDYITDVWSSPPKRLLRLTTRLGRSVRVTEEQEVLTPTGWKSANSLVSGKDQIALNGQPLYEDPNWLRNQYLTLNLTQVQIASLLNCSRNIIRNRLDMFGIPRREFHLGGWNRGMRRDGMPRYKGEDISDKEGRVRGRRYGLTDSCLVCGHSVKKELEVHHIDGIPQHDADANLMTLCIWCHALAHTPHAKMEKVVFDTVTVKDGGVETVYDLSTLRNHNYIGDGVVLHNCVRTLHAELNAIIQCALDGNSPKGGDLYTTASPCYDCAKMLIRAGIKRVYVGQSYESRYGLSGKVRYFLNESGIEYDSVIVSQCHFEDNIKEVL